MPALWWDWKQFELSEAAEDIGEMLGGVASGLKGAGYTGVAVAEDVHGFKADYMVAVVYLFIAGRSFWQVIAVVDGPEAEIKQVQKVIDEVAFL